MKHYNIKVTGKVQGVFYRQSTLEKAHALGIKGFVRNEADGSVYIEAEADAPTLDALIAWCNQGPKMAAVKSVTHTETELKGFGEFEIEE